MFFSFDKKLKVMFLMSIEMNNFIIEMINFGIFKFNKR